MKPAKKAAKLFEEISDAVLDGDGALALARIARARGLAADPDFAAAWAETLSKRSEEWLCAAAVGSARSPAAMLREIQDELESFGAFPAPDALGRVAVAIAVHPSVSKPSAEGLDKDRLTRGAVLRRILLSGEGCALSPSQAERVKPMINSAAQSAGGNSSQVEAERIRLVEALRAASAAGEALQIEAACAEPTRRPRPSV